MAGYLASRNPQAGLPTVVTLVLGPQTTLKAGILCLHYLRQTWLS